MEKFNQLKDIITSTQEEAEKFFEKGNKAAGTRLRKNMQIVGKLTKEIRKQVSESKQAEKAAKAEAKGKSPRAPKAPKASKSPKAEAQA